MQPDAIGLHKQNLKEDAVRGGAQAKMIARIADSSHLEKNGNGTRALKIADPGGIGIKT